VKIRAAFVGRKNLVGHVIPSDAGFGYLRQGKRTGQKVGLFFGLIKSFDIIAQF
jgi:hypothetical protein